MTTARPFAIMLIAPLAALLLWAHVFRPMTPDLDLFAVLVAGSLGLLGILTARWATPIKAVSAAIYIAIAVGALPLLALFAVCTTGDCL
jgi:hypothetical protein